MKVFLVVFVLVTLDAAAAVFEDDVASESSSCQGHNGKTCSNPTFLKALTQNGVYATPPVVFLAKENGTLVRCVQENPGECEVFYNHNHYFIHTLLIAGEYLFIGLANDEILRCDPNLKYSCQTFYKAGEPVCSLAAGKGHLFAGLYDGTIVTCELDRPNCRRLYRGWRSSIMTTLDDDVNGLIQVDAYLYVGLGYGVLKRCALTPLTPVSSQKSCTTIHNIPDDTLEEVANLRNDIYAVTWNGSLWKCPNDSACESVHLNNGNYIRGMKAFNGSLYVHNYNGICKVTNNGCESYEYEHPKAAYSIAMAYGTYHLQSKYKDEDKTCRESQCQLVAYYNGLERAAFEVHVKDGRLYNANDSLVDIKNADGNTEAAAIFAMGPDGKILLSNRNDSLRTSSFYAGNPVAGAGEMVVQNGVIKKIRACSYHYLPDLTLNKQVIASLLAQGYTDHIESEEC